MNKQSHMLRLIDSFIFLNNECSSFSMSVVDFEWASPFNNISKYENL